MVLNSPITLKSLLDEYVVRLKRMGPAAEAHALLSESHAIRDVFTHGASGGRYTFRQLTEELAPGSDFTGLDDEWLAKLARICALQDSHPGDAAFALEALRHANRHLPVTEAYRRFHQLEVELLAEIGNFDEGLQRIKENPQLRDLFFGYLAVDMGNPFIREGASIDTWLSGFNEPLRAWRLRPLTVNSQFTVPFDGLSTEPTLGPHPLGPKVSVVMTSYQPERDAFLLSARSILQQSWRNIELIIVDDATPGDFTAVLDEVQREDSRVRVIRLTENGGTYKARNVGMAEATGTFITGQDSDDWSHPDRLLTQVRYLQANEDQPGVVTSAIRTDENLVRIRRGQNPGRRCEVSFMVRREIVEQVGGYLPARKAADSEYRLRVARFAGREVGELGEPLYVIRLLANSLSRGDFRPGWSHPTRRAFWNACTYWHTHAQLNELPIDPSHDSREVPLPIPGRFHIREPGEQRFDVVFAADFRQYTSRLRAIIDEVEVLANDGWAVGLMQLESLKSPTFGVRTVCESAQALINSGKVGQIAPSESAKAKVVVLRDPTVMQFPPAPSSELEPDALIIVAEDAPSNSDGSYAQYRPLDVQANAERYFGIAARWVTYGPKTRGGLIGAGLPNGLVESTPWPRVLEAEGSEVPRVNWRGPRAVVGRHSENSEVYWPNGPEAIAQIWPTDGSQDIRILGDARPALRIVGERYYPNSWLVFKGNEISARAFYASVDFFVYSADERWPEDGNREILEAMAAGCVVVLPVEHASQYGGAAIYSEPDEVRTVVTQLRNNWDLFIEQSRLGRQYAVHHGVGKGVRDELKSVLRGAFSSGDSEGENYSTVIS